MMYAKHLIRGATLVSSLALFGLATAAAQGSVHSQAAAASHVKSTPRSSQSSSTSTSLPRVTSFRGIASKLNTTPQALESAYQAALAANPKLTRGQFIAANVLSQNLGTKDPKITTQAILDSLKAGKSIGNTLQSLGLSAKDSKNAQATASREIRQAQQEPKDSTK
jgi:hypothetical protein